jgi:hypothetical protein
MRRTEMLTAGGVTLAGLSALVGLAIGSGNGGQKLLVPRAQPVEVRTEIIRRTINVYRREHPHHAAGTGGGSSSGIPSPSQGARVASLPPTRTRSSGTGAVAPTAPARPVVSTRSSGSRAGSTAVGNSGPAPVKTRSSGASSSGSGSGSAHAVRTRASGGEGEGHSRHDD